MTPTTTATKLTEEDVKKIRDEKKVFPGKEAGKEVFIQDKKVYVVAKGQNKVEDEIELSPTSRGYEELNTTLQKINKIMSAEKYIENTGLKWQTLPATIKRLNKENVEKTYVINIQILFELFLHMNVYSFVF